MSLNVIASGQGPRLVLLHGWGLNSHVWDSVLPRLNKNFSVVRIDLPGHGASSWPPEFHDIDSLAGLIDPYIKDDDLLLGWSLGSMAAMVLACERAIRRLVLVAATPKFLRSEDWPYGVEADALREMAARLTTDLNGTIADFLALQVHGDDNARITLKMLREHLRAGGDPNPAALGAGLETLAAVDLRAQLPLIDMPTLVISGGRDRLSHPKAGAALTAALPQGQFHLIPGAAHTPFLSAADEFCTQLEQFLIA